MKTRSSFTEVHEPNTRSIRQAKQWIIDFKGLPDELLLKLSKTIRSCDDFCNEHAVDFQDISELAPGRQLLLAVKRPLQDLKSIRETLESFARECDNFTKDVSWIF